ncbi:MAG: hypothetical protein B6244_03935 [Candidatus Cloacimonetes bacterium 4572_55]|nr:MAG: hypothetical protein B6244_03935 [Candidatus Cloacimonetes bacterium 4572_55]
MFMDDISICTVVTQHDYATLSNALDSRSMPDTTVATGSAVTFRIVALNGGMTTESSPIQWTCSTGTPTSDSDENTPSLAPNDTEYHIFAPDWIAPGTPGEYTVKFFTALGTDEDPSNDTTTVQITVVQSYPTPYTQNFDDSYPPTDWYEAIGNPPPPVPGSSSWAKSNNFANDGISSPGAVMNVYGTDRDWLISPLINLGSSACKLTYKVAVTDDYDSDPETMAAEDTVFVLISTDGGITWDKNQRITLYTNTNSPPNSGLIQSFSLSAYTGYARFAFFTVGAGESPDMDIHFDDFQVQEIVDDDFGVLSHARNSASMSDTAFVLAGSEIDLYIVAKNFGTNAQSSDVGWRQAGDHGVSGSATTASLALFEADTLAFSAWTAPSTAGTYTLEFFTQLPGDADHSNDTTIVHVGVVESISIFPWTEDFETFTPCGGTVCLNNSTCIDEMANDWQNDAYNDDTNWRIDSDGTQSNTTGPSQDHNPGSGDGIYLYTEASGCTENDEAHLVSPYFDFTTSSAPRMSFWYHMYGASMGELHIDLYYAGSWHNDVTAAISGQQQSGSDEAWLERTVDLIDVGGMNSTRFRFRGIRGDSSYSDMAIDDVTVYQPPVNNCDLTAWQTWTGQDSHSLNVDPLYTSVTNLTPQNTSPARR